MSIYLSLAHSRRKKNESPGKNIYICSATAARWHPLCCTEASKWALVWGIHGPPRRLSQILRRPQALLLLFQLLWIPLARQLIGGNNKLGSLQPLANMPPPKEEREGRTRSHVWGWTCACRHNRERARVAILGLTVERISVSSLQPRSGATVHLCLSRVASGECVKSILHSFKEQPVTTVRQQRWLLVTSLWGCQWKHQLVNRVDGEQIYFLDCFRWKVATIH